MKLCLVDVFLLNRIKFHYFMRHLIVLVFHQIHLTPGLVFYGFHQKRADPAQMNHHSLEAGVFLLRGDLYPHFVLGGYLLHPVVSLLVTDFTLLPGDQGVLCMENDIVLVLFVLSSKKNSVIFDFS